MLLKQEKAKKFAEDFIKNINFREKFITLAILYWGEGNKKDFSLSNTDPKLIRLFVSLLREVFKVGNDRIRGGIRIYQDLNKEECLEFWSKLIELPRESFTGIQVLEGKKVGKLKYGMCKIRLLKGEGELKQLKGLYNAIGDLFAPIA
ncbi:hypothetical protein HY310_01320 [Candidatus Microgenomates bacterium]|nr:hypothetical protein [Candidatus Microgenomates bacterium]